MRGGRAMVILENADLVEVIDAADWRTKAAQEARREAHAAGRIPLAGLCEGSIRAAMQEVGA